MSLLLYCVMWAQCAGNFKNMKAVQDRNVKLVHHGRLAAVVSEFDSAQACLDVQTLLTYHDVINNCFELGALIPFRFKTLLGDENEVKHHLNERGTEYEQILLRLFNKVEMGLRLIIDPKPTGNSVKESSNNHSVIPGQPGKSYLAQRRSMYTNQEFLDSRCRSNLDILNKALEGVYENVKVESSVRNANAALETESLLSIYYLVDITSLEKFKAEVESIKPMLDAKVLLSGPWAPYNFV